MENNMYARHVSMELRPDSRADFTHKIESEILPLLRKQKGFQDEITFVSPAGKDAFAISLWDSKESAENYNRASFGEVTKLLSKLVEGTPRVKSYEVANSTFHKIAATQKAA
jgi:heme-degrading monooxygenase HmoA